MQTKEINLGACAISVKEATVRLGVSGRDVWRIIGGAEAANLLREKGFKIGLDFRLKARRYLERRMGGRDAK